MIVCYKWVTVRVVKTESFEQFDRKETRHWVAYLLLGLIPLYVGVKTMTTENYRLKIDED